MTTTILEFFSFIGLILMIFLWINGLVIIKRLGDIRELLKEKK